MQGREERDGVVGAEFTPTTQPNVSTEVAQWTAAVEMMIAPSRFKMQFLFSTCSNLFC